jgi:hypothetical protein
VLAGCARESSTTYNPPVSDARGSRSSYPPGTAAPRKGLSTGQKVAILAGAAALYYLYNRHKNKQGQGREGKYYLSKNGRVYYREPNGDFHWVSPPSEGIRVPASEADQYRDYAGYNGQASGRTFGGYGATSEAPADGLPGPRGN